MCYHYRSVMNYRRSRVYSAPIPKMPPGLLELMEGLSKDVLRNNPINIYEFCADHMQKLLQIRDDHPHQSINLEQKIIKAQKIVRERAKQRRETYDKLIAGQKGNFLNNRALSLHGSANVNPENIKISEGELPVNQIEDLDAEGRIVIIEMNNDDLIVNREAVEVQKINDQNIFEDESKEKGNEQNTIDMGFEKRENENQIAINLKEFTDIPNNEKIDVDQSLTSLIEPSFEINAPGEKSVLKESFKEAIDDFDQNIYIENENIETDATKLNKQSTSVENARSDDDKDIQFESKQDEIQPSVVFKPASAESEIIKPKLEQSMSEQSYSAKQQENSTKITGDTDALPEKKDDNNLINDGTHHNGMDLETAAITIQKVFRTFLFKSKTTSIDDATNVDINLFINDKNVQENINISNVNINKERRGISRMDTVLQTVNEEKSLSLSTDDSSTLSSAATIIQAHIRGFLVRNKFNVNKASSSSLLDSECFSGTSMETESDQQKGKTILNIHIVPERGHFTSRDESIITSMDLSMDNSPPSSSNLHPHSYDINERRKQLKREDAVQSVSPPSNNSSSKQSEDVDSVRELLVPENTDLSKKVTADPLIQGNNDVCPTHNEIQTAVEKEMNEHSPQPSIENRITSDESDVVTPFIEQSISSDNVKLMHSSEFHEVVLPTKVSRSDTSVVREFHNVLAYFLLWN
ncbi:uncharacterized protein LOC123699950 isoform X1 [Colias croceus]|uniref:uncharacterized protein LOC123699950 isoform X1 n=1 Tax=Colias crocea TaxID=72248 RepID=UPI001E2812FE|nr:uncharacterized protein LOC123699950 isoform X1 [Colias croceus]